MGKCVIIDDASIMRVRLKEILEPTHTVIGEASDGIEGVEVVEQLEPDFVTLDISMPHQNGLETLRILQENHPDVTVVIVSAVGQRQLVVEALSGGASDFVVKPFEEDRVLKAVNRVVEKKGVA